MHDHDGPTGEYFQYGGVQYYIRPDVLCGRNTRRIRNAIEDRNMKRLQGLVAIAGQAGANSSGFLQMANTLLGVPSNNQIFDAMEDENIVPLILTLCVEPELMLPKAQEIVNEYPHFPLLSKALLEASGIMQAAKNWSPPSKSLGDNGESLQKSATETSPESTDGLSTKSTPLATTSSS